MKVLVTGATGLLGANVVRTLLGSGHEVRVLVRETSNPRPLEGLDLETTYGDLRSASDVESSLKGVDAVIHSGAHLRIGWSELDLSREINVGGTQNVAKACLRQGAKLIHVSTVDTLGAGTKTQPADEERQFEPKVACSYVVSKREAEQEVEHCVSQDLPAIIAHPGFVLGPWDWRPSSGRMLLEVAHKFTPIAPSGGCTLCDARDVARGLVDLLVSSHTEGRFILGGNRMTYLELWRLIADVSGGGAPWFRAGPLMRSAGGRFGDLWGQITGNEPDLNSAGVGLTSQYSWYSSEKVAQAVGYSIRPARETVQDTWDWFQQYGYVKSNRSR